jgi:pimeloyl-ACP methyl ester carboxylesterase
MAYFTYNNKNIYYEDHGEGMPVVFLHGNTASSKMFTPILHHFAGHFRIILIDFLGHGQSNRVSALPTDLWYDEAMQVIALVETLQLPKVHLIGSSGGALVAINVALERPDLVDKVVADSFEGECALDAFTENIEIDRMVSKEDPDASMFYRIMHGEDWDAIVDSDTTAIATHAKEIKRFFHQPIESLENDILMIGTQQDRCVSTSATFLADTYGAMLQKIGHGSFFIFATGEHPAIISNSDLFCNLVTSYLK